MRTLGLLGGTSWVSTIQYYRRLNELANEALGGANAARLILHSFNLADIVEWMSSGRLDLAEDAQREASKGLVRAGAEGIMIGANTMHLFADAVAEAGVPVISVLDAVAEEARAQGWQTLGILGTKFTTQMDFYVGKLNSLEGVQCLVPKGDRLLEMHRLIVDELVQDILTPSTKEFFLEEIRRMKDQGADACVMACTEIPLLLHPSEACLPLMDTIEVHCRAGIRFAAGIGSGPR